jgi:tetratricopeptide (TPR) repeat protein
MGSAGMHFLYSFAGKKRILFFLLIFAMDPAFSQDRNPTDSIRYLLDNCQYQFALDLINSRIGSGTDPVWYYYKGLALKGVLKYPEAIESFQSALRYDPNNLRIINELSNTLIILGDYKTALKYLAGAYATDQDPALLAEISATLYAMEAYEEALDIYNQLLEKDTANSFLLRSVAKCYDNLNKTDSAIAYYEKAIARTPSDNLSVIKLGNLYIKNKSYKKGIELTELYRVSDTSNFKINRLNAYFFLLNQEYNTAKERFIRCIEQTDTVDFVYKYLGTSYFKLQKQDTAKIYLDKAYRLDSLDAQTCYFLGMACSGSYFKELGIYYLNRAIALMNPDPNYLSGMYQNLAEACNGFYKYQEGLDALLRAHELNKKDTLLLYKIAVQYEWLKDKKLALKYYTDFMSTRSPDRLGVQKGNAPLEYRGYIKVSYYDVVEKRIVELKKEIEEESEVQEK